MCAVPGTVLGTWDPWVWGRRERWVMLLQAGEHPGMPANRQERGNGPGTGSSSGPSEGTNLEDTVTLDLWPPKLWANNCVVFITRFVGFYYGTSRKRMDFPGGSDGKESACSAGDPSSIPESEKGMATHSSILFFFIFPLQYSCP